MLFLAHTTDKYYLGICIIWGQYYSGLVNTNRTANKIIVERYEDHWGNLELSGYNLYLVPKGFGFVPPEEFYLRSFAAQHNLARIHKDFVISYSQKMYW